MTVTRFAPTDAMTENPAGSYVAYTDYNTAATNLATAITNLTYAKTLLNDYLTTSPQALNGASVKLLAYVTDALTALGA